MCITVSLKTGDLVAVVFFELLWDILHSTLRQGG